MDINNGKNPNKGMDTDKGLDTDISREYELFLEHILGLLAIDKDGKVVYMNRQCAEYIEVDKKASIGKDVLKVFPPSKMKDMLKGDRLINTDFYFYDGRMSVSTQAKLRKNGQTVGVIEYDIIQEIESLDELFDKYAVSMRDEMKYYKEQFRKLRNTKYSIDSIIGSSQKINDLKNQIKLAAASNSTVIVTGETGVGKELVVHAIHNLSNRAFGNFIKINAAGVPESLAESEFFGYEEGAFTGAKRGGKKGKFELANDGTLFIDEINQMPISLQSKILRALQEHEIDKVGGEQSIKINARIIAATNQELSNLVSKGKFREDLFYRLNVLPINVPSLRERLEDLPELIADKVSSLNQELGKSVTKIDPEIYDMVANHDWPGNVRELFNVVEKAMNYVDSSTLKVEHFGFRYNRKNGMNMPKDGGKIIAEAKAEAERQIIEESLKMFKGNKTQTAKYLDIARPLLYQKMKRLGLKKDIKG
jgi:transcriptional regulator with PAS, ATPase and Fis domain